MCQLHVSYRGVLFLNDRALKQEKGEHEITSHPQNNQRGDYVLFCGSVDVKTTNRGTIL